MSDYALGFVKGMMDGDGYLDYNNGRDRKPRMFFGLKSERLAQNLIDAMHSVGLAPKIHQRILKTTVRKGGMKGNGALYSCVTLQNKVTCSFPSIEEQTKLASRTFQSREERRGYVSGFFQAEGSLSVDNDPQRTCYDLRIYNSNRPLIHRIRGMIAQFGVEMTFRDYTQKNPGTVPFIQTQSKRKIDRFVTLFGDKIR